MQTIYKDSIIDIELDTGIVVAGATRLQIRVVYPSGRTATWTGTASSSTKIIYRTQAGDLDEVGRYIFYTYVESGGLVSPGEPFIISVLDPVSAPLTISMIRDTINITDVEELSDAAIQSAIDRSISYVTDLASRSSASAAVVVLSKLNYSAFLAYQTYADRIVEQVPGAFDQGGVLQPVANPLALKVLAKLQGLKETSDETIALLSYQVTQSESSSVVPMNDASDYPEQMRMSTLKSVW